MSATPTHDGISVVIPVYNSEQTLPMLVERLHPVLHELSHSFELILVNDGSRDDSWSVAQQLADGHDWIIGINLMRNFGQHNALLCGIRAARYPYTVTMDDDLQNPPEAIPKMLARLTNGFDVVYGTPQQMQHSLLRNIASRVTKLALQSSMGADIATKTSAFRVFRTQLRDAFAHYRSTNVSIDVLLTWGTTRFDAVEVQFAAREIGTSNYTFVKLVRHALNMIVGFSILPLQLASMLGFTFVIFGIFVLIYVVGRYVIEGGSVPGFPFIASIVAIFSGIQLFALGIIGEYIARIHLRIMDRPPYVVREATQVEQAVTASTPIADGET